jgi:hypothetical protein
MVDQQRKALAAACTAQLVQRRNAAESRLKRYLASRRKVLAKLRGNPTLAMETPVHGSTFLEVDAPDPGMMGGAVTPQPPHAWAGGSFAIDYARPGHNYLRFHVDVENGSAQHRHVRAGVRAGMTFEMAPPEIGWFWVQRVWVPLWGFGEYRWHAGTPSCWDHLSPATSTSGGLRHGESIELLFRLEQDGPGSVAEHIDFAPNMYGCYSFTADSRDEAGRPNPFRSDYWDMGVIELTDAFAGMHDTDFVLFGRSNGGGTIRVLVELSCDVESYYKYEDHRIAFEGEGYLLLPFAKLEGLSIA